MSANLGRDNSLNSNVPRTNKESLEKLAPFTSYLIEGETSYQLGVILPERCMVFEQSLIS